MIVFIVRRTCTQRGSNPRPSAHKTNALPTELWVLSIFSIIISLCNKKYIYTIYKMYDTTRHYLEKWMVTLYEQLGWMMLSRTHSMDESKSEQHRILKTNKVNTYCEEITGLTIAIQEKIASLDQAKDSADIADLAVLLKTTKILQQFVSSTLMNKSFNQMGGKRRSKKSKKTSRK